MGASDICGFTQIEKAYAFSAIGVVDPRTATPNYFRSLHASSDDVY